MNNHISQTFTNITLIPKIWKRFRYRKHDMICWMKACVTFPRENLIWNLNEWSNIHVPKTFSTITSIYKQLTSLWVGSWYYVETKYSKDLILLTVINVCITIQEVLGSRADYKHTKSIYTLINKIQLKNTRKT